MPYVRFALEPNILLERNEIALLSPYTSGTSSPGPNVRKGQMAVRGFVHEADHVARAAAFWKKIHRAEIHGNNEPRMPVAPSRLRIGAATNVAVRAAKERKNETFAERKATLVGLNETFAERKATLVGLNETFAERKATLVGLNETLAERKATLPVLICLTAGIVFWLAVLPLWPNIAPDRRLPLRPARFSSLNFQRVARSRRSHRLAVGCCEPATAMGLGSCSSLRTNRPD